MTALQPASPFEAFLLEAQTAKLSQEAFLAHLLEAKVVVLLEKAVDSVEAWDDTNPPMILNSPSGFPVLAVFSSRERIRPAQADPANPKAAFEVDFRWLLRGVQPELGLVMNPGSAIGFEMPPADVQALKRAAGAQA
ncbi:MAG TPA: SseB family protein [Holophagaceae bacterium]|nr:SseB family protein [Holophagaceae bacterium]